MRVLHVIASLEANRGGPTAGMIGLTTAQAGVGIHVDVIATSPPETSASAVDAMRAAGVEVTLIWPTYTPLRWSSRIRPVLRDHVGRADVVHLHGVWEEVLHSACVIARQMSKPYVISPAGMLSPWALAQSRRRKKFYMAWRLGRDLAHASAMHYTSAMERDDAAHLRLTCRPIVEPNGVNMAELQDLPPRGTFRDKHPVLGDKKIVVFLGRVHPGKGLEQLIPAMPSLPPDVMLVVIGPDSEGHLARTKARAEELGIADRVVFTGTLSGRDKAAALRDADVFALPSDHENFGNAVVEAMAAGLPVVVSDHVGVAPMLKGSGVVSVVPLQLSPLVEAIQHWLRPPRPPEETAAAAKAFVRERFDWRQVATRWNEHFNGMLGGAKTSQS